MARSGGCSCLAQKDMAEQDRSYGRTSQRVFLLAGREADWSGECCSLAQRGMAGGVGKHLRYPCHMTQNSKKRRKSVVYIFSRCRSPPRRSFGIIGRSLDKLQANYSSLWPDFQVFSFHCHHKIQERGFTEIQIQVP
jgi:hypothetical protein